MHSTLRLLFLFSGIFFFASCSVTKSIRKKTATTAPQTNQTQAQKIPPKAEIKETVPKRPLSTDEKVRRYLNLFGPIAQREMKEYKIPASITLAQGLLESGFGEGRLAMEANNHFGIKCHRGWEGGRIYHDDDEKGECFRVYADAGESYHDHSLFLSQRERYAFLFRLGKKDYKAWAKGLKKAGYATDPKYPEKLIRLIERFELDAYDGKEKVLLAQTTPQKKGKDAPIYTVKLGDTLYSIAKKLNVELKSLKRVNDLNDNTIYIGQELVLPKK